MSAANRRRGHDAERQVSMYLRGQGWPDAVTTRAKLGHDGASAPGDIDWHPLIVLEVKDVAHSAWPSWCRQAMDEAPAGTVPVVVRRARGLRDVGRWECRYWVGAWRRCVGRDLPGYELPRRIVATPLGDTSWHAAPFEEVVAAVRDLDRDDA